MEQNFDRFLMFKNRLEKVYKHIGRQAKRQGIGCFRIYDHDLPEFPFLIEVYENELYVSEYKRNHSLTDAEHETWLGQCKVIMAKVLDISVDAIFLKVRQRKENRLGQYKKLNAEKSESIVREGGLQFVVNLTDYLDTGLFLDHRITRQMVKDLSYQKRVLNLFCYTGSFSVYAVAGGASSVVSVDLSKTYLSWAEKNIKINFPDYKEHQLVHADVMQYLKEVPPGSFDLIVMDPPTFSNSKRMEDFLDIQRDHVLLINGCMNCLKDGGVLFFSTNFTRFQLNEKHLHASVIKDITKATTAFDFAGKLNRQCFRIIK